MSAGYQWLAAASAWWWPRFADHLWQSTLFALLLLAATFALRSGPARWRHTLCVIASVKFLVPIALFAFLANQSGLESLFALLNLTNENSSLVAGITEPAATIATSYEVTVLASYQTNGQNTYLALTALWLAGTLIILLFRALRRRTFLRTLDLGEELQSGREWLALENARKTLRINTRVGLVISPAKIEPGVWRAWRPVIVLPASMATMLDDDELEAIMLHELIHIQRRDNLVGHFQLALCALLWFHPLVWFISRRLFDEREQACDERVMEICAAPQAYASSILKVVRFCFGWKMAGAIGAAGGANLRRRIENIMTNNTNRRASGHSRALATALIGLAFLFTLGAGFYSRANSAAAVGDTQTAISGDSEPVANYQTKQTDSTKQTEPVPATPPAPPNVASPPAPPTEASPPTASTPAAPAAAPAAPSVVAPPAPLSPSSPSSVKPLPATPATPPTPATPAVKSKDKPDKNKDDKDERKAKENDKGHLIEAPPPVYPEEAKEQKIEGTVVVEIVINDDGNVISAKAKTGPVALHAASEQAAAKARFRPMMVNGKPAKVSGALSYNFVLDKK